jgi:hypothetical protein
MRARFQTLFEDYFPYHDNRMVKELFPLACQANSFFQKKRGRKTLNNKL